IFNYVDTDFGDTASNAGANATVGIKGLNSVGNFQTVLALNAGSGSSIINNFATGHAVRFSSNTITTPLGFGTNDAFGYKAFRTPFESKVDLVSGTANGQTTSVILSGTFDNSSGFQTGPQNLQSTITVGTTPVVSNN